MLDWLDVSGLALYFLDRMTELHRREMLPDAVLTRLEKNLADNTLRTQRMIAEAATIHHGFQRAGVSYALLKGMSLCPSSVPRPELRSQLDLDFLVAELDMPAARAMLEERGYYLHAVSGRSWEFKTRAPAGASIKNLYKDVSLRSIELHAEIAVPGQRSLLASREVRTLGTLSMPVLSSADLFLGQGLHLYKHVCGEFYRAAHLLEFCRHVLARRDDDVFWREVESRAAQYPFAWWALGVVTLLGSQLVGSHAPDALLSWTAQQLPASARLWVEMYGWRSTLGRVPGNKLYLLLQEEFEKEGAPARRPTRRSLIPLRLPPLVVRGEEHESLQTRMRRYRIQFAFVLLRLRFHVIEGLRYAWELPRWRLRTRQLAESDSISISPANKGMTIH